MKLDFKLHYKIEEIEELWVALGEQQLQFHFYQKPAWFKTITQALIKNRKNNTIFYIGIYQKNAMVGIIPIECLQLKKLGFSLNVIRFPTHYLLDLSDCLISESIQHLVLEPFLNFINTHKQLVWDIIFFAATPEESCTNKLFANNTLKNYYGFAHGASSFIQCKNDFDQTIAHISSKFKRNIKRLERKAQKQGQLSYVSVLAQNKEPTENDSNNFSKAYQNFLDVEADSWKSATQTAIKYNQQAINFYQQLAKNFKYPDSCFINLLALDNKTIAVQFGIKINQQLNLLKIGFRQDYKPIGPGNIILTQTIKQAINQETKQISMVTAPVWAEKWKTDSTTLYRHIIFNQSFTGLMAKLLFLSLPLLKKIRSKLRELKNDK
ncbi:MAG: GNAT family N-acetyltransferase [Pseudomonadota bacterium]